MLKSHCFLFLSSARTLALAFTIVWIVLVFRFWPIQLYRRRSSVILHLFCDKFYWNCIPIPMQAPQLNSCTSLLFDVTWIFFFFFFLSFKQSLLYSTKLMHIPHMATVQWSRLMMVLRGCRNRSKNKYTKIMAKWLLWSCNESSYFRSKW